LNYSALEQTIGYQFKQKETLIRALTHASKSKEHLERQEFLGDAVLGLTIAEYLHQSYPQAAEGILSKMRANLVCKQALLDIAKQWKLEQFLIVGAGELTVQGELKSHSIAANAVESVIGAVFQDSGWEVAKKVILSAWSHLLASIEQNNILDAKSQLQELTQANGLGLPLYQMIDLGLQKSPRFQASCYLNKQCLGTGTGDRKKSAELNAAQSALQHNTLTKLAT